METKVQIFLDVYLPLFDDITKFRAIGRIIGKFIDIFCRCTHDLIKISRCNGRSSCTIRLNGSDISCLHFCRLHICADIVCKDQLLLYHLICLMRCYHVCMIVIDAVSITVYPRRIFGIHSVLHRIVIHTLINRMAAFAYLGSDRIDIQFILICVLFACISAARLSNYRILHSIQRNLFACLCRLNGSLNACVIAVCCVCSCAVILADRIRLPGDLHCIANLQRIHCKGGLCSSLCQHAVKTCILGIDVLFNSVLVTFQEIHLIELRRLRHPVDLREELVDLVLDRLAVRECIGTVGSLHRKLIHSLQHIMNFCQRALCCLHRADTVLCI